MEEADHGTFVCELCKQEFARLEPSWLTVAVCERTFGRVPDDPTTLCSDCYEKFIAWFNAKQQSGD